VLTLLTRTSDGSGSALAAAAMSDDDVVARLARFHAVRLSAGAKSFSTTGPGFEGLAGAPRAATGDGG